MALIPEKLTNFKAFAGAGSNELLGITDVELPNFEPMTETISGAGIAGEYESPTPGHFGSMEVKLKWRTVTRLGMSLLAPVEHSIVLMGAVQVRDSTSGTLVVQAVRVALRGQVKGLNPGKLEPGKPMDVECTIEIARILITLDSVDEIEFDKFNMIFKVRGVDYLAATRAATGG